MDYNPAPKPKYKRFKTKRSERVKFSEKVRNQIKEHLRKWIDMRIGKIT